MPWTPKADSPGVIALRDPKGGLHGLDTAEDGMLTDRAARCPGWSKK